MQALVKFVVVAVLSFCVFTSVSAQDNADELMRKLEIKQVRITLLSLDFELQSIMPQVLVSFAEYRTLSKKITEITAKDAGSMCSDFRGLEHTSIIAAIRKEAGRVVETLERAEKLVASGGTPPETLATLLKDGLLGVMKDIVASSHALESNLQKLEESCKKAG